MNTKRIGMIISFLFAVTLFSMMNVTTANAACAHIATGTWEDSQVTPPTCCSKGKQVMKCGKCGTVLQEKEGTLKPHKWKKDSVVKDATCTKYGTTKYRCQYQCNGQPCHATKTEDDIKPLGHVPSSSYTTIKAATCTKDGQKGRACTRSGCSDYVDKQTIAKLGHNLKRVTTKEATCCAAGEKADVCQRKNCTYKENVETIKQKSHKWAKDSVVKKATCTTKGITEYRCQLQCNGQPCHATKTEKDIPVLGHSPSSSYTTIKEATCTKDGEKGRLCSRCSEYVEKKKIDALGHNLKTKTTKKATCEGKGEEVDVCQRKNCSYQGKPRTLQPLGHLPSGSYTTIKAATCTDDGEKGRRCSRCSQYVQKTKIDKLGHLPSSTYTIIKAPTCTEDGKQGYACTRSGCSEYVDVKVIEKHGHQKKWIYPKDANCNAGYTRTRSCSVCGHKDSSKDVEVIKGHKYGDWKQKPANHLPCEYYSKYHECKNPYCSVSEDLYNTDGKLVKFRDKEHEADGKWVETKHATCEKDGLKVQYCKYGCGTVVKKETIPKKGHDYTTATCQKVATCKNCGDTKGTYGEHDYSEKVVKPNDPEAGRYCHNPIPATTVTTGIETRRCSVCKDVMKDVLIPRIHSKNKNEYEKDIDLIIDELEQFYIDRYKRVSSANEKEIRGEDFKYFSKSDHLNNISLVLEALKNEKNGIIKGQTAVQVLLGSEAVDDKTIDEHKDDQKYRQKIEAQKNIVDTAVSFTPLWPFTVITTTTSVVSDLSVVFDFKPYELTPLEQELINQNQRVDIESDCILANGKCDWNGVWNAIGEKIFRDYLREKEWNIFFFSDGKTHVSGDETIVKDGDKAYFLNILTDWDWYMNAGNTHAYRWAVRPYVGVKALVRKDGKIKTLFIKENFYWLENGEPTDYEGKGVY